MKPPASTKQQPAAGFCPAAAGRGARRPAASAGDGGAVLAAQAAGARAGVRGARRGGPQWRFRPAPRRNHAVPGAGASPGVRQRRHVLGVFLRRPRLAGAGPRRRRAQAVRCRRSRGTALVCRRCQADVLRAVAGDPVRHVRLRAAPCQRIRRPGGAAGRRLLVRTGRLCPEADDRVCGHRRIGGAAGGRGAARRERPTQRLARCLAGGAHRRPPLSVRPVGPGAARELLSGAPERKRSWRWPPAGSPLRSGCSTASPGTAASSTPT